MSWDVTVTDTLAESYIQTTSPTAGAAAEGTADRKELKYQSLAHPHTFIPLALFNLVDASQLVQATCEKLLSYFDLNS